MLAGAIKERAERFSFALAVVLTPPVVFVEANRLLKATKEAAAAGVTIDLHATMMTSLLGRGLRLLCRSGGAEVAFELAGVGPLVPLRYLLPGCFVRCVLFAYQGLLGFAVVEHRWALLLWDDVPWRRFHLYQPGLPPRIQTPTTSPSSAGCRLFSWRKRDDAVGFAEPLFPLSLSNSADNRNDPTHSGWNKPIAVSWTLLSM